MGNDKMKGSEFTIKILDGELGSSDINIDDIKDDDEIELILTRIFVNGKFVGHYHYI